MRLVATLLVLCLSVPARALDCAAVEATEVGKPLSDDQARCIQAALVNLRYEAQRREIEATEAKAQRDACEATASIVCPPAEVPVVPVTIAALAGFVVGVSLVVALVFGAR